MGKVTQISWGQKLEGFVTYAESNLHVLLNNAEQIDKFPEKEKCKSDLLDVLFNNYVDRAHESVFLKIYEIDEILEKAGHPINRTLEIETAIDCRNKLLAHKEDNQIRKHPRFIELDEKLKQQQLEITKVLRTALNQINEHSRGLNLGVSQSSGPPPEPRIGEDDIRKLVLAAPECKLGL